MPVMMESLAVLGRGGKDFRTASQAGEFRARWRQLTDAAEGGTPSVRPAGCRRHGIAAYVAHPPTGEDVFCSQPGAATLQNGPVRRVAGTLYVPVAKRQEAAGRPSARLTAFRQANTFPHLLRLPPPGRVTSGPPA